MAFIALAVTFFVVCSFSWWIVYQSPECRLDRQIDEKWKVRYFKRSLVKLDLCDIKSYENDYFY
jgi:hypothetical protein